MATPDQTQKSAVPITTDFGAPAASGAPPAGSAIPLVSRAWLWNFALIWFGFWLLVMLPGQFMVAKISAHVAPADKVAVASFLIAEMAVVILVTVPIIGVLCDRTRSRFGRRRIWAVGGFLTAAIPFALVGVQASWPAIAALIAVVAVGQSAILVSLSAMIADQVPRAQRGRASAAMGVPQVFALAIGMVLVTMLVTSIPGSWALIAGLALLSAVPFLLFFAEPHDASPAPQAFVKGIRHAMTWPNARSHPGYYWAMTSRVLINAGNLVGTTYLLFFLADIVKVDDPDTSLLVLILIYLVACGVTSYLCGILSDRWGRRRIFVALAALLQAAAALLLAMAPSWEASMVAAVLLGLGFGAFLSVDQALITDLLPDPATHARDLGIINSAQHIPIAPLVGWLVLSLAGYRSLYAVAAVIIVLGGLAVYRIKSVR
ncbi:MFS transporter [Glaciibacter psychrotolerans]|uniref:MFS family permease n=1 Tax=Glaciibacter psychrotolerans TaxID=670054 RepID=A0A7Z0ECC6_9MICO|nr:MFS transporter [Leifsonia psychrotolerans]NYJ19031.1 MFS family permease [Leifsonia psychrotolerans]